MYARAQRAVFSDTRRERVQKHAVECEARPERALAVLFDHLLHMVPRVACVTVSICVLDWHVVSSLRVDHVSRAFSRATGHARVRLSSIGPHPTLVQDTFVGRREVLADSSKASRTKLCCSSLFIQEQNASLFLGGRRSVFFRSVFFGSVWRPSIWTVEALLGIAVRAYVCDF